MRALFALLAFLTTAVAAEYAPYRWSRDLPKELATTKPASHKTAAEVDALFARHTGRVSLDEVLAALGRPDGFTQQALYSATRGTAQPQPRVVRSALYYTTAASCSFALATSTSSTKRYVTTTTVEERF